MNEENDHFECGAKMKERDPVVKDRQKKKETKKEMAKRQKGAKQIKYYKERQRLVASKRYIDLFER